MSPASQRRTLRRMVLASLAGAVIDLNGRPRYVHSGWFLISVREPRVIVLMIVVFALAICAAVPARPRSSSERAGETPTWTSRVRASGRRRAPARAAAA